MRVGLGHSWRPGQRHVLHCSRGVWVDIIVTICHHHHPTLSLYSWGVLDWALLTARTEIRPTLFTWRVSGHHRYHHPNTLSLCSSACWTGPHMTARTDTSYSVNVTCEWTSSSSSLLITPCLSSSYSSSPSSVSYSPPSASPNLPPRLLPSPSPSPSSSQHRHHYIRHHYQYQQRRDLGTSILFKSPFSF